MRLLLFLLLFGSPWVMSAGEFPAVMAEANLEKRSDIALREADKMTTAAKTAYEAKNIEDFKARIADVQELVALSYQSLQDTGKRARRNPKYFKRAEMSIRALMRRLDSLANDVSIEDRPIVEAAHKELNTVHENVLHDIMSKK